MNSQSVNLNCSFHSGPEDYSFIGTYGDLIIDQTKHGKIIITTQVLMTSGCHIYGGCATLENGTITLTYKSWDNGSVCLEQYSCDINFTLSLALLPTDPVYILKNDHQSRPSTHLL